MKTPLVLMNLLHQRLRTCVAVFGVAFAILLIFMQLGFYGSAELSATSVYDALDFDLLVRATDYLNLTSARSFPRYRLQEALGHPAVAHVAPVYLDWAIWRNTKGADTYYGDKEYYGDEGESLKYRRAILVLALNLNDRIFNPSPEHGKTPDGENLDKLAAPNTVLVDTYTRSYFGKHDPNTQTELNNGVTIKVVGEFTIGPGLGADGLLVMSDQTYANIAGAAKAERPALGLIKLKGEAGDPAAVREHVKNELKNYLNTERHDIEILTRDEVMTKEKKYWLQRTPVGSIFFMGVAVAVVVGIFFVSQLMATDIDDRKTEYATLKAMGYSRWYVGGVVLRQALAYAVLGYVPGFLAALLLYWMGRYYWQILLFPTWMRSIGVLLLSILMCSVSGILATVFKVEAADPADLF